MSRFVTQMIEVSHSCYCRHGSGFGEMRRVAKELMESDSERGTHEPEFTHSADAKDFQ